MSDWVIESVQEIVSKMNRAERALFPTLGIYIDGLKTERNLGDKLQQDVWHWLSPPDPWKNHDLVHKSRHNRTGTWWIQGESYREWKLSGPSSLLWINGKRQYPVAVFFPETDYRCVPSGSREERHLVR